MKILKPLKSQLEDVQILSTDEQTNVKGGLLITCEEKRRSFFGISYTATVFKYTNDGRLCITVKM